MIEPDVKYFVVRIYVDKYQLLENSLSFQLKS